MNNNEIDRLQKAYFIAATYLCQIGLWPHHCEQGTLGYLMKLENIKESISMNPEDWYKNWKQKDDEFLDNPIKFSELPEEANKALLEVMKILQEKPTSQDDFKEKCLVCRRLGDLFDRKVLELKRQKTTTVET